MSYNFYQYATWILAAIILFMPLLAKHLVVWPYIKRLLIKLKVRGLGWHPDKVEHIYTDAFGNRWYRIKRIGDMLVSRAQAGEIACNEAQCRMTLEYMTERFRKMLDCMNPKDGQVKLTEVASIATEMLNRSMVAGERETLTRLACVYFYLEGENMEKTDPRDDMRKRAIWAQDKECEAFFLQAAYSLIADIDNTYNNDIVQSIKEQEEKTKAFHANLNQFVKKHSHS